MTTDIKDLEHEDAVLFASTVRTPVAPMHGEPRIASQMISQQVAGHRVDVLDEEGDWVRARGEDGYEGWMHVGFLARTPQATARGSSQTPRISLGCITRTSSGDRRSLPFRAVLAPDEAVQSGETIDSTKLAERFPLEPLAVIRTARDYFSATSYLWGGVTPWGADCSGLVQTTFWLHGIQLRRDAWQQAEQGVPGEAQLLDSRTGDLLFFSDRVDGHITHVAIALGNQGLVHLALGRGGYAVENLADEHDPYVAKLHERFVKARRVLGPALIGD